jgi:hypothetical protein
MVMLCLKLKSIRRHALERGVLQKDAPWEGWWRPEGSLHKDCGTTDYDPDKAGSLS